VSELNAITQRIKSTPATPSRIEKVEKKSLKKTIDDE